MFWTNNMKILDWIEDQIDKRTPIVEVTKTSNCISSQERFLHLKNELVLVPQLSLRSSSKSSFILKFSGRTCGELSQWKVAFGKTAEPKMYMSMKSKFKCTLLEIGNIEVKSYEHFAGLKKEIKAFQEVLADRLKSLLIIIEDKLQT